MDGDRFDDLVRVLASPTSRRRFLGGLTAAVLGLAGVRSTGAAAARRGPGRSCREDDNCVAGSRCRADARGRRVCVCDAGTKACGNACISTSTCCQDSDCRAFGSTCAIGVCAGGQCQARARKNGTRCPAGVCCDGGCVPCCNGVGNCIPCETSSNCPGQDSACTTRTCLNGFCGVAIAKSGTVVVAAQGIGDCQKSVCNGSGVVVQVVDDADLPADDGNACTTKVCRNGTPAYLPVAAGTACNHNGGTLCNDSGTCVACLVAGDCPGVDTECLRRVCDDGACGVSRTAEGTALSNQTAGDCRRVECDGLGGTIEVIEDADLPDDGDPCTQNLCTAGVPSHPPAEAGTPCGENLVCDGLGECSGCANPSVCPGADTECQTRTCQAGRCGFSYAASGTVVLAQTTGDCKKDVCDGAGGIMQVIDDADVPADDGNPCTANTCSNGVPYPPLPAGTECRSLPASVCDENGACVALKLKGEFCQSAGECTSGFCVDGVCCDTACDGICRACTAALRGTVAADGVCGPIQDGTDPDEECPGSTTCNGSGACNGCTAAAECPGQDDDCQQRTCVSGVCGLSYTPADTPTATQTTGDCKQSVCDGAGGIVLVNDDSDLPVDDGNDCTEEVCSQGTPGRVSRAQGFPCGQSGGAVCDGAGACVGCLVGTDCPGVDTECQQRTCTAGTCGVSFVEAGTPVSAQTEGDCKQDVCDGSGGTTQIDDDDDVPLVDDGNQCTENTCSGGVPYPPKTLGSDCTQFGGAICNGSGTCVPQAFNGAGCTLAVQCRSGDCVDGFCCDSICTAPCRACNVPDHLGSCVVAPGSPCSENGGTQCDASGQCVP